MRIWFVQIALAAGGFGLLPAAVFGQGAIGGAVRDTSGGVLPGVSVEAASPVLIERVRTATTDDKGQYLIVDLRPGVYSVTFTLAGFTILKREGLELTTGVTLPINAREFHVYAAEWTPAGVAFFVDGDLVRSVDQSPAYPMQLMLNIYEFPGNERRDATGSYPKEFVIDYVRGHRILPR